MGSGSTGNQSILNGCAWFHNPVTSKSALSLRLSRRRSLKMCLRSIDPKNAAAAAKAVERAYHLRARLKLKGTAEAVPIVRQSSAASSCRGMFPVLSKLAN